MNRSSTEVCLSSPAETRDAQRYLDAILEILHRFTTRESLDRVAKAASVIADALRKGRRVHLLDNGHFLGNEFYQRAGGVPFLHRIQLDDLKEPAVVRSQDVLIVASVSGRSSEVVDGAMLARERGVYVMALTSLSQSQAAPPLHPSGKRLYECADLVLDIGGVPGDGLLDFPNVKYRFGPASGISSAVLLWMVLAQTVGNLLNSGIYPTIFPSVNIPGGAEAFQEALADFERRGI
ncbi:MAG TPA: sugar isomerase domain-containing protein [Firmicutes bacterium]|nr:sugar isomerase domain-containing protein [Bacillota bacterium]